MIHAAEIKMCLMCSTLTSLERQSIMCFGSAFFFCVCWTSERNSDSLSQDSAAAKRAYRSTEEEGKKADEEAADEEDLREIKNIVRQARDLSRLGALCEYSES